MQPLPTHNLCSRLQLCRKACRAAALPPSNTASQQWTTHKWNWKGNIINYAVAGCGAPVLLIHGFGVNYQQWRKTIAAVSKDHKVYAIDLLGFGGSDKAPVDYSIELWAEQVADFCDEFAQAPVTLVGNSIGSLVSLEAARKMRTAAAGATVQGIVLINCAGGMNNKARLDDWRVRAALPIFLLIDIILKTRIIAKPLFDYVRTPENVRKALENVYCDPSQVDDELVGAVCRPAGGEGALDVLVAVFTGPPGPKPELLLEATEAPVLILWGDQDPLTPLDSGAFKPARAVLRVGLMGLLLCQGPVGQFCEQLPDRRKNVQFQRLPGAGHCAMDDASEQVHSYLLPWLMKTTSL